ncbi:hypothetical protein INT44_000789, partial [Umbelopsis vinacea]
KMFSRAGSHGARSNIWKAALATIALGGGAAYYYNGHSRSQGILDSDRYIPLKVQSQDQVSHDTWKLRLELKKKPSSFSVPSSVYIKDDSIQIMRPYTPINDPSVDGHIDLLVKRYEQGSISKMLCRSKPGEEVFVRGPMVEFEYPSATYKHVAMIAGGTGITPMYQLIRHILSDPKECQTKMTLIYANKTEQDILLRNELADLEKQHPDRLDIHYTLDHPSDQWRGGHGYVSLDMVRKHLPAPSTNGAPNTDIFVFVSGPEA